MKNTFKFITVNLLLLSASYIVAAAADNKTEELFNAISDFREAKNDNIERIVQLINQGADIKAKDQDGNMPLHLIAGIPLMEFNHVNEMTLSK